MMKALHARDGERLGQILRKHLKSRSGMIKEALEELRKPDPT